MQTLPSQCHRFGVWRNNAATREKLRGAWEASLTLSVPAGLHNVGPTGLFLRIGPRLAPFFQKDVM